MMLNLSQPERRDSSVRDAVAEVCKVVGAGWEVGRERGSV